MALRDIKGETFVDRVVDINEIVTTNGSLSFGINETFYAK